ncbi:hypothetical protein BDQ17DRAFT_1326787 [Cyathus striatus]|nr:hypothetical protein BDQ17DRAFT_1326787 [Cyathus striatus]
MASMTEKLFGGKPAAPAARRYRFPAFTTIRIPPRVNHTRTARTVVGVYRCTVGRKMSRWERKHGYSDTQDMGCCIHTNGNKNNQLSSSYIILFVTAEAISAPISRQGTFKHFRTSVIALPEHHPPLACYIGRGHRDHIQTCCTGQGHTSNSTREEANEGGRRDERRDSWDESHALSLKESGSLVEVIGLQPYNDKPGSLGNLFNKKLGRQYMFGTCRVEMVKGARCKVELQEESFLVELDAWILVAAPACDTLLAQAILGVVTGTIEVIGEAKRGL